MCVYASPYPEKVHAAHQCKNVMPLPVWLLCCKRETKGRYSVYEFTSGKRKADGCVVLVHVRSIRPFRPRLFFNHSHWHTLFKLFAVCCVWTVEGAFSPLMLFCVCRPIPDGGLCSLLPCSFTPPAPLLPCSLFSLFVPFPSSCPPKYPHGFLCALRYYCLLFCVSPAPLFLTPMVNNPLYRT